MSYYKCTDIQLIENVKNNDSFLTSTIKGMFRYFCKWSFAIITLVVYVYRTDRTGYKIAILTFNLLHTG